MKPISDYGCHLFAELSRSVARNCYSLLFHLFPIVMLVNYISCNSLYERAKVWGTSTFFFTKDIPWRIEEAVALICHKCSSI